MVLCKYKVNPLSPGSLIYSCFICSVCSLPVGAPELLYVVCQWEEHAADKLGSICSFFKMFPAQNTNSFQSDEWNKLSFLRRDKCICI